MQHLIATYGYVAIFVLMVAESACLPVPSELIMTFGGALAAGAVPGTSLNLIGVIAAGVAGNVVGSYIAWAVGWYGGQPALRRWGHRLWLRDHDLDRATNWFARYGPRAVLIGRLLPVVRTFISLPAGVARMPFWRFTLLTAAGCAPWVTALALLGKTVGANWETWRHNLGYLDYVIVVGIVIGAAYWLWTRRRPDRRGDGGAAELKPAEPK